MLTIPIPSGIKAQCNVMCHGLRSCIHLDHHGCCETFSYFYFYLIQTNSSIVPQYNENIKSRPRLPDTSLKVKLKGGKVITNFCQDIQKVKNLNKFKKVGVRMG